MLWFFLFILGLVIGSFLNVVGSRYDGDHFVFDSKVIGGRSHCSHCGRTLRWFELIPLFSFAALRGRCRTCKVRLGIQYPVTELISGLIIALVPLRTLLFFGGIPGAAWIFISAIWVVAFELLFLISIIDFRLGIIPDELNFFLLAAGIFLAIVAAGYLGLSNGSLIGVYGNIFGLQGNIWINRMIGAAIGGGFFGLLVLVTRGRGMGLGDVKLAVPLGFLFGWPDIALVSLSAFVIGAVVGVSAIVLRRKTMKGSLPFAPFLAIGALVVFFFGFEIVAWYFGIMGL